MGSVSILMNGDGALQDWADASISGVIRLHSQQDSEIRALYLTHGMESGKPACMLAGRGHDGDEPICIELSVEMFMSIAAAFKGKYESEGFTWR